MAFIDAFGWDVSDDLFNSEFLELKDCFERVSASTHECSFGCAFRFTSAAEATAGVLCVDACHAEGSARSAQCAVIFWANLAFHGKPPDNRDPDKFFEEEIKPRFPATKKVLHFGAAALGAWGTRDSLKAGAAGTSKKLAKALGRRASWVFAFGLAAYEARSLMEDVFGDPPDDDFRQIFKPREFDYRKLVAPLVVDADIEVLFQPAFTFVLQVISLTEGIAVSLDRAAGAAAAGEQDLHFAQLRISQVYAKVCAESLKRMQNARLGLADTNDSMMITEGPFSEESLIMTPADAAAVEDVLDQKELDEPVRQVLEKVMGREDVEVLIDDLADFVIPETHFGKTTSDILRDNELVKAENTVMQILNKWAAFYRAR
jgi:hypothetical protein